MKTHKSSGKSTSAPKIQKKPGPQRPLVTSPAKAAEEVEGFRRDREAMESAPTTADTSARTSLF